jgi:hypothetical protein
MSSEALLLLLAVGLYVYDSAMLLYDNEALMIQVGASEGWRVFLPKDNFDILGRALFIPNPLFPFRPVFRLCWHPDPLISPQALAGLSDRVVIKRFDEAIAPLKFLNIASLIVLFICIPCTLLVPGARVAFFVFLPILYGIAIAALVYVFHSRTVLGLDVRACIALGVESFICIPVFPNLIRKISNRFSPQHDLVFIAEALLTDEQFTELLALLLIKVKERMAVADEESEDYEKLAGYSRFLAKVME